MDVPGLFHLIRIRIKDIRSDPIRAFNVLLATVRGCWYIAKYSLFCDNAKIKFPFRVYAPVKIIGEGHVSIGKGCSVYNNVFQGLTIVTLSRNARVLIGERCGLGGLTIRCRNTVTIGSETITANSLIQDVYFIHNERLGSSGNEYLSNGSEKIDIGENVWICGSSIILEGSTLGKDSILSFGSLCFKTEIKDYCIAISSPVKRILPIDKMLKLRGWQ